jgi:hypothetical protein
LKRLLLVVAIVSVTFFLIYRSSPESRLRRLFGGFVVVGPSGVETVRKAWHVEAYRLGPLPNQLNGQAAKFWDYPEVSGSVDVSDDAARLLADVLLDPSSYSRGTTNACVPRYSVRLDFSIEKELVAVLLCFECNQLTVHYRGTERRANFDAGRPTLVREIRRLFPDDPEIQALSETK